MDSHFPTDSYQRLYEVEANNFWFRSRNRIILYILAKFLPKPITGKFLEIGCGTAFVLKGIAQQFPALSLTGTDLYKEGLVFASKRLPEANFIQLNAEEPFPIKEKYNHIGAFDVLEHIKDDQKTFKNIYANLNKNGLLVITVPQHQFLWSFSDVLAKHKRRYSKKELINKLEKAHFEVLYTTSFVFSLLPFMIISRLIGRHTLKNRKDAAIMELRVPKSLNYIFEKFMRIDELLIKLGLSLPWGGSLLAVAKKTR